LQRGEHLAQQLRGRGVAVEVLLHVGTLAALLPLEELVGHPADKRLRRTGFP
jgi:hypothetical protein